MGKVVTLGEIMLRLSSDAGIRIAQSENFSVHFGGGEANVAISLANYGHQVTFASKVPANGVGEAVKKHLNRYNVDTSDLLFGGPRLGTYYLETGIGERAANVVYDRAGSSFAMMETIEWDSEKLFAGVDIFHISGITPALSDSWKKQTLILIKAAKQAGCKISFDINYRGKLWSKAEAGKTIREILPYVDYCSAGKLDAQHFFEISSYDSELAAKDNLYCYKKMQEKYPNVSVFYSTKRKVYSASVNALTGTLWANGNYYESKCHQIDPIVDRVGGGDAFAGGVLHGLLNKDNYQKVIDFATAASALKHTVHGDCNQFSQEEVESFLALETGKIIR
ncbi:sugar kinase [Enterococcus termitis]|uniref:2-dehydro-3-deoxygluconokinase n=1 Tax=Enterococcus termitis TaxID=332950 RepID=A0A1E5G704_9ENTE|nr:sugar kinase [Enterococcus termitis]OEG08457.1 2-dehydro-3-deoxygluconokinase [Enterococcus termitis]OJG98084.1 2-dehydro-3-deoxygluconokinase [Enterococcus termitis]